MIDVRQTDVFAKWLDKLTDESARARIATRIVRLRNGLFGDAKAVGGGVSELRINYGPGYRLYFVRRGEAVVVLLCGGSKKTQRGDIKTALAMAKELE